MNHILTDPALEAQPNFEFPAYAAWLNAIIAGGLAREEALAQMAEGWRLERQERITLWLQQSEEDLRAQREQEEQERIAKEAEAAEEQREAEKKKPKINDFDIEAIVADVLIPRPSQYALQKIKSMEYVELWYFSPEGCREASESSRTTAEDSFGLAKVDGYVAFKPMASFKASQKALQDHDLSWRQFDMAKTSFLVHIDKSGWPDKHQQALALFFTLITNHEHRVRPRGEKTLLRYAGFVRREWHDRLTQNQGFNIGIFNSALYNTLSDDVWEAERDESIKLVLLSIKSHHPKTDQLRSSFLPCFPLRVPIAMPASTCFRFHAATIMLSFGTLSPRPLLPTNMKRVSRFRFTFPLPHIPSLNHGVHQLQNAIAAPNAYSRPKGRETSSGKEKEPFLPAKDNRYHLYRPSAGNQPSKKSSSNQQSFPSSTGQAGPAACALCLGRFHHNIHKCTSEFLWDKRTKARCSRNAEGHVTNPEGRELCYDWQRPRGCASSSHSHVHECSGCGAKDHGAQDCPQSEAVQSPYSV